ncbi:MAG: hypothetical protein IJ666_07210 [Ruminococcus sp.]|nr:hypothetical protein [Ruminococcus sp.]
MKTKKIVIGAMAAAMLSLSVCSIAPVAAADETVQISVSETTAEAGGAFTVDVSLADIPATGLQGCQFSLSYDSSLITVTEVEAGALTKTGAENVDSSAASLPIFSSYIDADKGNVNLMWSTMVDDASYWLKGEGVFCTVKGTVSAEASGHIDIKAVPTNREVKPETGVMNTEFGIGYAKDGQAVKCSVNVTNGGITIGDKPVSTLRGDVNLDGKVTISDAVRILQYLANNEKYDLVPQAITNGDVDGTPGISGKDAARIQLYDAGAITEL